MKSERKRAIKLFHDYSRIWGSIRLWVSYNTPRDNYVVFGHFLKHKGRFYYDNNGLLYREQRDPSAVEITIAKAKP